MHLAAGDTEAHTEGQAMSGWPQTKFQRSREVCGRLGAGQLLVKVEAEEAGEQLAGRGPPDKVGQDAAEEERREQAAQGPRDPGRRLLGLVLPRVDKDSVG